MDIGPITDDMARQAEGKPPALIQEWLEKLKNKDDFVFLWAAATKKVSWYNLYVHISDENPGQDLVATTPAVNVERMLSPLAHEGRIRVMQVLYEGTCSAGELASRTGFQGGGLYHHLRELRYARCISESKGRYSLTPLGRQLLVTMIMMARNVIKDRGEEGLAAGANWD